MPVQNKNSIIFAHPELATYLLQILIPTTFNSLLGQDGQCTLQPCPKRWFVRNNVWLVPQKSQIGKLINIFFACPKRRFSGNCLAKRQVRLVLAKSLSLSDPALLGAIKASISMYLYSYSRYPYICLDTIDI